MKAKIKIVVVLGPTAGGKSDLAVKIAEKFNGEVISADSRQVYKGLNIGSGKITERETRGFPTTFWTSPHRKKRSPSPASKTRRKSDRGNYRARQIARRLRRHGTLHRHSYRRLDDSRSSAPTGIEKKTGKENDGRAFRSLAPAGPAAGESH